MVAGLCDHPYTLPHPIFGPLTRFPGLRRVSARCTVPFVLAKSCQCSTSIGGPELLRITKRYGGTRRVRMDSAAPIPALVVCAPAQTNNRAVLIWEHSHLTSLYDETLRPNVVGPLLAFSLVHQHSGRRQGAMPFPKRVRGGGGLSRVGIKGPTLFGFTRTARSSHIGRMLTHKAFHCCPERRKNPRSW
jgi:hypothetical protein